MDRANEERLAEIEFVCAGCGEVCLICDLETDVALTHCTECANKRIRELEDLLARASEQMSEWQDPMAGPFERILLDIQEALADD